MSYVFGCKSCLGYTTLIVWGSLPWCIWIDALVGCFVGWGCGIVTHIFFERVCVNFHVSDCWKVYNWNTFSAFEVSFCIYSVSSHFRFPLKVVHLYMLCYQVNWKISIVSIVPKSCLWEMWQLGHFMFVSFSSLFLDVHSVDHSVDMLKKRITGLKMFK